MRLVAWGRLVTILGFFVMWIVLRPVPASAASEYCPAEIGQTHAFGAENPGLYSFYLKAESARAVSGDVLALTDAGWYSFSFPYTAIAPDLGRYASNSVSYARTEYFSKALYVRFPNAVHSVTYLWVSGATSIGDGLGWQARGKASCPPVTEGGVLAYNGAPGDAYPDRGTPNYEAVRQNPVPVDLNAAPASQSVISAMGMAQPPWSLGCKIPQSFSASVARVQTPALPGGKEPNFSPPVVVTIITSISASGTLDGAELYQPSGNKMLDDAALAAAQQSTYEGGSVVCNPAPGHYLFRAWFP